MNRRELLKRGMTGAAALAAAPSLFVRTQGDLTLRPYPHPLQGSVDWAYLTDERGDAFESPVEVTSAGISVPASVDRPFAVNARWFVEGFGHVWLEADNGG